MTYHASDTVGDLTNTTTVSSLGVAVVGTVTSAVLLGAIAASFLDRTLASQGKAVESAQEGEAYFRRLAEAIPTIIWTADADGNRDFANSHWTVYTGLTVPQSQGLGWRAVLHPDDVAESISKWEAAFRTGNTYEVEYRLRRATDGVYQWFLSRASPVRDDRGHIIKWFGTITNIEEQKHNQQILEEQIKERTEQLADANTRLQEEIWERDLARRALDEQNEKMVADLTARSHRATLLAKMGELLQSCQSKDEVFAAALGFAPRIFTARRGAIALLSAGRDLVEVAGQWHDCRIPVNSFEPEACWALRTGHPHLVAAGDSTAPCAHAAGVTSAYLCIPIIAQGEALGILHLQATDEAPVMDVELPINATFAAQVGLSVANIKLREALRIQSIRDPLTGLYNRRYLTEILDREIRRAVRAEQPLSILMLDLDHFKKFNDTYGHDAGDTVLRETAAFLSKSIRVEDVVCRFGGEEFVILLPTADLNAAHARAERICKKLRELTVLHQGHSLGVVTVSVGVAALPVHGTTSNELIEAADAALYCAKRDGRDRVVDACPQPAALAQNATAQ